MEPLWRAPGDAALVYGEHDLEFPLRHPFSSLFFAGFLSVRLTVKNLEFLVDFIRKYFLDAEMLKSPFALICSAGYV